MREIVAAVRQAVPDARCSRRRRPGCNRKTSGYLARANRIIRLWSFLGLSNSLASACLSGGALLFQFNWLL